MATKSAQAKAWRLTKRQHWVITRRQLLDLGFSIADIRHRIDKRRLIQVHAGVYAVGRPTLAREGYLMAAVLACGKHALLSHLSAAAHWGIVRRAPGAIHVTVPAGQAPRRPGIKVHRRAGVTATSRDGIPLTGIVDTLVDIAPDLSDTHLERAINEAVNRDLIDPERLRASLPRGRPGVRRLTRLLDRSTYVTTETILEQRMLRIALRAGLPKPEAQRQLGGARVDFVWPALKLIVEADSLRFHRTTLQQQADGLRDQRHAAAGFLPLRFTHYQIMFEPDHVERTLRAVARNSSRQLRQPYHTIPD